MPRFTVPIGPCFPGKIPEGDKEAYPQTVNDKCRSPLICRAKNWNRKNSKCSENVGLKIAGKDGVVYEPYRSMHIPTASGGNLGQIVTLLKLRQWAGLLFLPFTFCQSVSFRSRPGFSVIDYDLNEQLADREDLDQLKNMGIPPETGFYFKPCFRTVPTVSGSCGKRGGFCDTCQFFHRLEPLLGRAWNHDGGRLYPAGGRSLPEADVFPQTRVTGGSA